MADGQRGPIVAANLHTAFQLAQADFKDLKRTSSSNRGKYAPLDEVLGTIIPALHKHGLTLSQPTRMEGDFLIVETRITHADTGEILSASYPVGNITKGHTDLGAGLTFARRYSLMALAGVFPDGEDKPQDKRQAKETKAAPDLTQAAGALRVKLMGATSLHDINRIWNANRKLIDTLDEQHPEERVRIGQLFDDRVFEFNAAATQ